MGLNSLHFRPTLSREFIYDVKMSLRILNAQGTRSESLFYKTIDELAIKKTNGGHGKNASIENVDGKTKESRSSDPPLE